MAVVYRRSRRGWGFKSWHSCRNCSKWPHGDFEELRYRPNRDLCRECERLQFSGKCNDTPRWF